MTLAFIVLVLLVLIPITFGVLGEVKHRRTAKPRDPKRLYAWPWPPRT